MRNQRSASLPSSWAASSSDTPDPGAGGSCPRGKGPPTAQPFGGARSPHPPRLPRRSLRSRRVAGPRGTRGSRTSRSPVPPASRRRRMSERLTNDVTVDAALDALKATGATGEVFLREAQSGSGEIKEGALEAVIARGGRGRRIRERRSSDRLPRRGSSPLRGGGPGSGRPARGATGRGEARCEAARYAKSRGRA